MTTATLPHLQVVFSLAIATVAVRWAVHAFIGPKAAAVAGALISAMVLGLLWIYYALTLVGLDAWGQVVSWRLISTYARQGTYVADQLGVSARVAAALVLALFGVVAAAIYAAYLREDWLGRLAVRGGRLVTACGVATAFMCAGAFFWDFQSFPPTAQREPVALTFWPEGFEQKIGSRLSAPGARKREREDYARLAVPGAAVTNVILIVSDALRSRNMGVYGYPRPTTPYLSRLVEDGSARRMLRAESVCSQSHCGLFGIASGRYVHQIPDAPLTLPEVLRMHGYRAHMVLGGDHTNFYGLRKMYGEVDSYFDGSMGAGYMNDDSEVIAALRRLELRGKTGNFIQLHLMSSHVLGRRNVADRFGKARGYHSAIGGLAVSREDQQTAVNFYDAGVAQADEAIRQAVGVLREKGLMEDALVIVAADHGELLGEHGLFGHAKTVHGEVIDIPLLLIRFGRAAPLEVDERQLASQVDIAPTVLAHLGLPIPRSWTGVSLLAGRESAPAREVFFQQGPEFGLVARQRDGTTWKYWINAATSQEFAYDLDADPAEQKNLAAGLAPALRQRWHAALLPLEANVRDALAAR